MRSLGDDWVRVQLEKDDLLILPAGIYHRFTTDESNVRHPPPSTPPGSVFKILIHGAQYVHAMRLFKDEPKWTPLNRCPQLDGNDIRKEYVGQFLAR